MPLAAITMNFMNGWVEGAPYSPALNPDLLVTGIRGVRVRKQRVRVLVGAFGDADLVSPRARVSVGAYTDVDLVHDDTG